MEVIKDKCKNKSDTFPKQSDWKQNFWGKSWTIIQWSESDGRVCSFTVKPPPPPSPPDSGTAHAPPAESEVQLLWPFHPFCGHRALSDLNTVTLSWAGVKCCLERARPCSWQRIRTLRRDELITLPGVALFHFHLAADLHWTMAAADLKVPLSFLHGWWTPPHLSLCHPGEAPQRGRCLRAGWSAAPPPMRSVTATAVPRLFPGETDCGLFNYSRWWIMSFSVFYLSLSWPVIPIWRLRDVGVDGRWQDGNRLIYVTGCLSWLNSAI